MPLTNAEKQQRWKERNQVVLTWDARDIATKLAAMPDQGKLRKIVSYLKDHLKQRGRTLEKVHEAHWSEQEKRWLARWLVEHPSKTAADYRRAADTPVRGHNLAARKAEHEAIWAWRRAKGEASVEAEQRAWLIDHPGNPLPEHLCSLTAARGAEYDRWLKTSRTLREETHKAWVTPVPSESKEPQAN